MQLFLSYLIWLTCFQINPLFVKLQLQVCSSWSKRMQMDDKEATVPYVLKSWNLRRLFSTGLLATDIQLGKIKGIYLLYIYNDKLLRPGVSTPCSLQQNRLQMDIVYMCIRYRKKLPRYKKLSGSAKFACIPCRCRIQICTRD